MKRLTLASGSFVNYPSADVVSECVGNLSDTAELLVLTDTHAGFVQVMWGPQMGEPDGTFVIETKGPHVEGHVRTVVLGKAPVEDVFSRFLADDASWVDEHAWDDVDLSED